MRSMTGFGKSHIIENEREYQIEIKSLNHRYLDISVRMPRKFNHLEDEVRKVIAEKINRGKVEVNISFKDRSAKDEEIEINKEIAKCYLAELRELAKETELPEKISVIDLAKMPEILEIVPKQASETMEEELLKATKQAVDKLVEMRNFEGEKIGEDLLKRLELVQEKIIEISNNSSGLIEEYIVKLEKRIKDILKDQEIDQSRISQEVVIYADKTSIEEELTRLNSHVAQFKDIIMSKDQAPVGKKMDFLIQEMNREVNTIGSKSNKLEIINNVVDVKTEMENIREQIQNIE